MKAQLNSFLKSLIFVFCLSPISLFAQDSPIGNWLVYIGNKSLKKEFNWHSEVQYRNYNAVGDLEQLLLRTGIGKNLTEGNNNLLLGYGFIRSENYFPLLEDKVVVNEHRIFQQFITKQKVNKVGLQHRYRFEQRFVEEEFKMRFRYFLGVSVPLMENAEGERPWYLAAYNEIFLNTTADPFDRNRLYGGIGHKLNDQLRLELGYMNQFLRAGQNRDQINLFAFVKF